MDRALPDAFGRARVLHVDGVARMLTRTAALLLYISGRRRLGDCFNMIFPQMFKVESNRSMARAGTREGRADLPGVSDWVRWDDGQPRIRAFAQHLSAD